MPLNKFIPTSPDLNITKDSDMGMAQFGHLNTIVDYLNTYVAADSLQLEGVGPLSATARYITDSAGNLSSLAISTGNIGIGTTNPFSLLTVGGKSSFYSVQSAGVGSDFFYSDINPNLTAGANNQVVSLVRLRDRGATSTGGFTGTQRLSLIMENAAGGQFPFQLFSETGALRIGFGSVATPIALVAIRGVGSTSATTSLLVQNSSGTTALSILDDGTINTSFSAVFNANFLLNVYYDISCRSIGANANATGGTLGIFGGPGGNASGTAVSIGFRGSPVSGQIGTSLKIDPIVLQSATQIGISFNGNYTLASVFGNNTLIGYDFSPTNFGANPVLRAFQSSVGGVYVNTTSYQASAILQADSTTQGFLPPRMTTAQKNLIATPAIGLQIFDTDLNRPCFYNGAWVTL
jgi:hypothetical protein